MTDEERETILMVIKFIEKENLRAIRGAEEWYCGLKHDKPFDEYKAMYDAFNGSRDTKWLLHKLEGWLTGNPKHVAQINEWREAARKIHA